MAINSGLFPWKIWIFHSYVKLPEGNPHTDSYPFGLLVSNHPKNYQIIPTWHWSPQVLLKLRTLWNHRPYVYKAMQWNSCHVMSCMHTHTLHILVGGIPTPLKNDGVRQWVPDDNPYMTWKIIQSCLKPPTSCSYSFDQVLITNNHY